MCPQAWLLLAAQKIGTRITRIKKDSKGFFGVHDDENQER